MIHYTKIACDRCGDMYEILNTVIDEVGDRFVCNRCLRAPVQERLNEPDADAPSHFGGCETSGPSEVELDSDLIADLKQQLDLATDSSDFWYEQSMAGCRSYSRLYELLKSKEADLENERRAGDAMQAELERLESRWVNRLHAWLRGVWRYNIYYETCVKGEG
jgi:hypothetical protein